MAQKFFITGTGTDVGKTYIAAGLSKQFCVQSKIPFQYLKPYASGVTNVNTDVAEVANAIKGLNNGKASGWYKYKEPASPYIAARNENIEIEYESDLKKINQLLSTSNQNILVEGAGGVFVPITNKKNVIDLIVDLQLPVIIVGHLSLGTVNHTCLTIQALQNRKCSIAGFVLNQTKPATERSLAENTNEEEICRLTKVASLGIVPYNCDFDNLVFQDMAKRLIAY